MDMDVKFVLFLLPGLSAADNSVQFQYPCYQDICTFPTQYCNSNRFEQRCSPCTRESCKESKLPLACKYMCRKYEHTTKSSGQGENDSVGINWWKIATFAQIPVICLLMAVERWRAYRMGKMNKERKQLKGEVPLGDAESFLEAERGQDLGDAEGNGDDIVSRDDHTDDGVRAPEVVQDGMNDPYRPTTNFSKL